MELSQRLEGEVTTGQSQKENSAYSTEILYAFPGSYV